MSYPTHFQDVLRAPASDDRSRFGTCLCANRESTSWVIWPAHTGQWHWGHWKQRRKMGWTHLPKTCWPFKTAGKISQLWVKHTCAPQSSHKSEQRSDESIAFFKVLFKVGTRRDIRHILDIPEVMYSDTPLKITYKYSRHVKDSRTENWDVE